MGDRTAIEWTDATWNPLIGCTKAGPGCDHCYAISVVHRGMSPQHVGLTAKPDDGPVDWTGEIRFVPEALEKPLRWRRPRRIFVNSLSDLFHPAALKLTSEHGTSVLAEVVALMTIAEHHTFQVLTKRPQVMAAALREPMFRLEVNSIRMRRGYPVMPGGMTDPAFRWPSNIWWGTSIESNRYAFRADHLRNTPAAVRWISAEPLLGSLDELDLTGIDWLVVGGESGPGARPMHPQWVRDLRDRCQPCVHCDDTGWVEDENWSPEYHEQGGRTEGAGLIPCGGCNLGNWDDYRDEFKPEPRPAFLFKQWGAWSPETDEDVPYGEFHADGEWIDACLCVEGTTPMYRVGKKAAGRELDGRTWDEYPEEAPF